jgi:hypothetical protein
MSNPDPYAHYDAAYVLDALDPAEKAEFEAHLPTCADCRARVADVGAVPDLLTGLDETAFLDHIAEAELAPPPPETLLPGLLRRARGEQKRRRFVTAGLGLVVAWPSSTSSPQQRQMTALAASPVSATVSLEAKNWGTEIDITCWYKPGANLANAYDYKMVAYDKLGEQYTLGSWTLNPGTRETLRNSTALPENKIAKVQVEAPDGTPILQLST